jgi:hypothetical protein
MMLQQFFKQHVDAGRKQGACAQAPSSYLFLIYKQQTLYSICMLPVSRIEWLICKRDHFFLVLACADLLIVLVLYKIPSVTAHFAT